METRGLQTRLQLFGKPIFPAKRIQLRAKSPSRKKSSSQMISIIIPAHNEEAYLPRTLEALQRQNYPNFEIIVVANGCTDATTEVAKHHCHRLIELSQKNLGVARNLGARMARGDLLVFLDADTLLEPLALRIIAEQFRPNDAAGTIRGEPDCNWPGYHLIYLLKNFFHRTSLHSGSSGLILCWRKDFMKIGGFDERLEVRENSELIWRLRRFGHYRYIGEVTATTSMRRYQQQGLGRMFRLWIKLWFQTHFGDLHQGHYETVR